MSRIEYRCPNYYPAVLLVGAGVIIGVWVTVGISAPSTGALLFRWLLLAVPTGFLVYGYGWRIAYRLWCEDGRLFWRAPLGGGSVNVSEVNILRDALPRVDALEVRTADGVACFVRIGPGLLEFARAVQLSSPKIVISTSRRWERAETSVDGGFRQV